MVWCCGTHIDWIAQPISYGQTNQIDWDLGTLGVHCVDQETDGRDVLAGVRLLMMPLDVTVGIVET